MAASVVNVRLARETQSRRWISVLGAVSCAAALVVLCLQVDQNRATRHQLWILVGMVAISLGIEVGYRARSGLTIHVAPKQE